MNLNEMIAAQCNVFNNTLAQNVQECVERGDYVAAVEAQTKVVNATYDYDTDRKDVGGPTALYAFTKDVRNALRAESGIGRRASRKSARLSERARFDALLNNR